MPEPDPPNPPLAPIDIDTPCIRCNYNLRGLSPAAICPECGTAVAASLPDQYGSMCAVGVMPGSLLLGLGLGFAWIFYHVPLLEFFLKASAVTREHRASTGASST